MPALEGAHTLHEMADADELFLTSAALGVALVTTFDYHPTPCPSAASRCACAKPTGN